MQKIIICINRLCTEVQKKILQSKKQYSNDEVALLKINTPIGKYGVSIQFANGTNQISTAFKSTDKGIDEWIKKGSANTATSEPLPSREISHTVAVVGQNPTNIVTYIKEKINPTLNQLTGMPKNEPTGHNIYNKNNGENPNIYYQSSYAPKTIQKAQEVKKLFKKQLTVVKRKLLKIYVKIQKNMVAQMI